MGVRGELEELARMTEAADEDDEDEHEQLRCRGAKPTAGYSWIFHSYELCVGWVRGRPACSRCWCVEQGLWGPFLPFLGLESDNTSKYIYCLPATDRRCKRFCVKRPISSEVRARVL
eukprot:4445243-Prymnesium_polylepis.1